MTGDVIETFIKGRKNVYLPLIYVAIVLGMVLVATLIFAFLGLIGITIVVVLTAFGIYSIDFLKKYNRLEYELSISMGDLSVTEIRNQARRKPVLTCKIREITDFKIINPNNLPDTKDEIVKIFAFNDESEKVARFSARGEDAKQYEIYVECVDIIMNELSKHNFEIKKELEKF